MSKGRRRVLITLAIVAALGAIGALAYDHAARGWDAELARARAALAAAAVMPVTSGRDGSMALEAALSQLPELTPDQGNSIRHEIHRLFAPQEWERALEKIPRPDREREIAEHDQHLDQALRSLDRAFPLVDEALFRYDYWRFGAPRDYGLYYPHWDRLRALVDLLSARLARSARLHHEEAAWDDAERLLRLASTIDDPYVSPLFMRRALFELASSRIETLHGLARLTDPRRRIRLLAELEHAEGSPNPAARALAGDTLMVLDCYATDDAGLERLEQCIEKQTDRITGFLRMPRPLQRAVLARDRPRYASFVAAVLPSMRLPWTEAEPRLSELDERFGKPSSAWAPLTSLGATSFRVLLAQERQALAHLRLTRLALAATAGSQLPPKPLELEDPFSPGHSLGWQVKGSRDATASSVGYDGKTITFEVAIPPGQ
jgi:hypothetical protein